MGTVEERQKTAETNRGIRAQQQLLRAQQNRQAIALAGLRQESGLLANVRRQTELLDRETRNAGGGARLLSRAFGELAGTLGANWNHRGSVWACQFWTECSQRLGAS